MQPWRSLRSWTAWDLTPAAFKRASTTVKTRILPMRAGAPSDELKTGRTDATGRSGSHFSAVNMY